MKNNNNVNVNTNPVTEDIRTVNPATPISNVTVYSDDSIDTVTVTPSNPMPMLVPGAMVPQEKGFKAFLKRHHSGITTALLFVSANLISYGAGRESIRRKGWMAMNACNTDPSQPVNIRNSVDDLTSKDCIGAFIFKKGEEVCMRSVTEFVKAQNAINWGLDDVTTSEPTTAISVEEATND